MAEEFGWTEEEIEAEIKDAEGLIRSMGFKLASDVKMQQESQLSICDYQRYLKVIISPLMVLQNYLFWLLNDFDFFPLVID